MPAGERTNQKTIQNWQLCGPQRWQSTKNLFVQSHHIMTWLFFFHSRPRHTPPSALFFGCEYFFREPSTKTLPSGWRAHPIKVYLVFHFCQISREFNKRIRALRLCCWRLCTLAFDSVYHQYAPFSAHYLRRLSFNFSTANQDERAELYEKLSVAGGCAKLTQHARKVFQLHGLKTNERWKWDGRPENKDRRQEVKK